MNRDAFQDQHGWVPPYAEADRVQDLAEFHVHVRAHIGDADAAEHVACAFHERSGWRNNGQPLIDVEFPRFSYDEGQQLSANDEREYLAKEMRPLPLAEAAAAICSPDGPVAQMRKRREVMAALTTAAEERRRLNANLSQRTKNRHAQQTGRIAKLSRAREARALCYLGDKLASDTALATTAKRDPAALMYMLADALLHAPLEVKIEGYDAIHNFAVTDETARVFKFGPLTEETTDPLDGVE